MTEEIKENRSDFAIRIISDDFGIIDIENDLITYFEMIEDIFSVSMVGKVTFLDKSGAVELLPITGNEIISITYGENETTRTFIIYDFKKIHQGNDQYASSQTAIEMYFVEPFYLALTQHKYSVSWKDKKISDIISDICTNMLAIYVTNSEDTNEILPYFYMPYWTPLEALKWLIPRGSGVTSGTAGYLFYSNTKGMNYHTMETLFKSKNYEKSGDGSISKYVFADTDNLANPNKILSWSINPIDLQSISYLSGGHKLGYDSSTKSFLDFEYTYSDIISKYTMMGKKTLFFDISNDNSQYYLEGDNDMELLKNLAYHEFITRYSKQFAVSMMVRGLDQRYAGMIIDIPWKSSIEREIKHKMYEGKFLVKSITHQFSGKMQPTYRQLIVAIKTGYTEADTNILHKSTLYDINIPSK